MDQPTSALNSSFSLTTTGLVATLLVLYLLDRGHLSATRRRLKKLRRTLWSFLVTEGAATSKEEDQPKTPLDRPTSAGVRNALGQLVSSIYTLPGKFGL